MAVRLSLRSPMAIGLTIFGQSGLAELNFWSPSATNFRALEQRIIFVQAPCARNFIVGGGVFAYANSLPCSLAWEAFGKRTARIL